MQSPHGVLLTGFRFEVQGQRNYWISKRLSCSLQVSRSVALLLCQTGVSHTIPILPGKFDKKIMSLWTYSSITFSYTCREATVNMLIVSKKFQTRLKSTVKPKNIGASTGSNLSPFVPNRDQTTRHVRSN